MTTVGGTRVGTTGATLGPVRTGRRAAVARPSRSRISAPASACSTGSCVATTTAAHSARSRTTATATAWVAASRSSVGSSSTTSGIPPDRATLRARARARARATLRHCPADRARPSSPAAVSAAGAVQVARMAASSAAPRSGSPRRTSSATVSCVGRGRCGTHARLARHISPVASPPRIRPSGPTRIAPLVGVTCPSSSDRTVLFPAPLGPTSTGAPGRAPRG